MSLARRKEKGISSLFLGNKAGDDPPFRFMHRGRHTEPHDYCCHVLGEGGEVLIVLPDALFGS